jgi:K+-sensing histidine kinase KdpD
MQLPPRQLINDLSHYLRTPLTIIYGNMQSIMRHGDNLTVLQHSSLKNAILEMEKTIELLRILLDSARANIGISALNLEPLLVESEIRQIVKIFKNQVINLQLESSSKLDLASEPIFVDAQQFRQIIFNLIEIVIDHLGKDGQILIVLTQKVNWIQIEISGNSQTEVEFLDYSPDNSRIAIAQALTQKMGGTINWQITEGRGISFILNFPIYK